jgi:hypothetical protein
MAFCALLLSLFVPVAGRGGFALLGPQTNDRAMASLGKSILSAFSLQIAS